MKVVVTGAAGFIGSHLVEELVRQNYQVVAIDNLKSGRVENLDSVMNKIEFHETDVRSNRLSDLFAGASHVYHLAALADIVPSISNPYEYLDVNVMGTTRVLEAARDVNVKRFIYAASSSCYGIPDVFPTPEGTTPNPLYPYALSKYLGEQVFFHWQKLYRISGLSLRFFNVYGPRSRTAGTYGAVLGVFLAQKEAGLPLTIVGDGTQTRDFVYVSDVVNSLILAGTSSATGIPINIGASKPVSINRLAELIGGPMTFIPKRPGEPDITHAEITRAREFIGWNPKIGIEEGVKAVLTSPESWIDAPVWTTENIQNVTSEWFRYLGK